MDSKSAGTAVFATLGVPMIKTSLPPPPVPPAPNYMTPQGYARLKRELLHLLDVERPELVKVVSWAASNGDRSENGDYLYGKKRLREIDGRIHYLNKRLDKPEVVDPAARGETDQIFFGATVDYTSGSGEEHTVTIVGVDEVDTARGHVSWISPIAKALLKRRAGDSLKLVTPGGIEEIEITDVRYINTATPDSAASTTSDQA
jgi:transcription elongation factor GreB